MIVNGSLVVQQTKAHGLLFTAVSIRLQVNALDLNKADQTAEFQSSSARLAEDGEGWSHSSLLRTGGLCVIGLGASVRAAQMQSSSTARPQKPSPEPVKPCQYLR
ncbi:hypothetical protein KC323_g283 [Hortaea werneckii]|nr:hypothetical protein KC323_g283 [Hortaea werneckii]